MQIEDAQGDVAQGTIGQTLRTTWITALGVLQLEELTGILDREPCDVRARCERGMLWWRSGRPTEAYIDLTLALRCDPSDVQTLTERGNLFHAAGRYDDALKDYAAALSECDTCTWLLYNEALSFRAAGRLNETVAVLETLVAADSADGEAWLMLGDCRSELGRHHAACQAWQRSERLGVLEARTRIDMHCGRP
jgi:tetratricopeptide (TPR) repeat protein